MNSGQSAIAIRRRITSNKLGIKLNTVDLYRLLDMYY